MKSFDLLKNTEAQHSSSSAINPDYVRMFFPYEKAFRLSHFTRILLEKLSFRWNSHDQKMLAYAVKYTLQIHAGSFFEISLNARNTIRGNFTIELRQNDPAHTNKHARIFNNIGYIYALILLLLVVFRSFKCKRIVQKCK